MDAASSNAQYGSFHLAQAELALPVEQLQEVVDYPNAITHVPLAPDFLLGMFNLRGKIIPIVHLASLLKLTDSQPHATSKVAIVELGHARAGLLFDATGEVLRTQSGEVSPFEVNGKASAIVTGAITLDDGERTIYVLDAHGLPQLDGLTLPQEDDSTIRTSIQQIRKRQQKRISFRLGDNHLALPMAAIQEIIRIPAMHSAVSIGELCLGEFNLRGQVMPVLDLAHMLGLSSQAAHMPEPGNLEDTHRIIIVRHTHGCIGLLVDAVESIVGHPDEQVLPIPTFRDDAMPGIVHGYLCMPDGTGIVLLDADALMRQPTIMEMQHGNQNLFGDHSDQRLQQSNHQPRETWITFQLEQRMGMRIEQLREIIDCPDELDRPPGSPDFVSGVLDLRHELIPVIDLRMLYGLPPCEDSGSCKVLIVEHAGDKCGLVVDAVEDIVHAQANQRIKVPAMLREHLHPALRDDMQQVLELPDQHTVLLIDAEPLVRRMAVLPAA